jgi:hypothetical protein
LFWAAEDVDKFYAKLQLQFNLAKNAALVNIKTELRTKRVICLMIRETKSRRDATTPLK